MNSVNLIGRIATEIVLRTTATNLSVASFSLAVDRGYSKEKELEEKEQGNPTADFFNVVIWGKMADVLKEYSSKGKLVGVSGRLQTNNYNNKEGVKVYITEIVANNIDILEWNSKNLDKNNKKG